MRRAKPALRVWAPQAILREAQLLASLEVRGSESSLSVRYCRTALARNLASRMSWTRLIFASVPFTTLHTSAVDL